MRLWAILFAAVVFGVRLFSQASAADSKPADRNEVFTVVLMPDTQFYCQKYPETYIAQTMWIRERVRPDNIKFVVSLGDIVQNAHVEQEWKNANEAARILDGVVPYAWSPATTIW